MTDSTKHFYIRKPIRLWYGLGVLAAVFLPVLWGAMNAWPLAQYIIRGCDGIRSGNCWGPNFFVRNKQLVIPIYLTFIFGTLFSALLGTLEVRRKINKISKGFSFGIIGLKSATWAHLLAAIIHIVYLLLEYGSAATREQTSESALILIAAIPIHLLLWGFITVPLGLICGLIFKTVAVISVDINS